MAALLMIARRSPDPVELGCYERGKNKVEDLRFDKVPQAAGTCSLDCMSESRLIT